MKAMSLQRLKVSNLNVRFAFGVSSAVAVQQVSGSWRMGWPVLMLMSVKFRLQVCAVSYASTLQARTDVTVSRAL